MKPADVARLADEEVAYWHASQWPLAPGAYVSRGSISRRTPRVVDRAAPLVQGVRRNRDDYFFMTKDVDCLPWLGQDLDNNFLYRVKPLAPVTKANFGWIEKIFDIAADDPDYNENPSVRRAAKAYWTGRRPRGGELCLDEYLTTAFEVLP